jgi:hypothetical protein
MTGDGWMEELLQRVQYTQQLTTQYEGTHERNNSWKRREINMHVVIRRGDMRVVYAIYGCQLGFSLFVCFPKELKYETNQD